METFTNTEITVLCLLAFIVGCLSFAVGMLAAARRQCAAMPPNLGSPPARVAKGKDGRYRWALIKLIPAFEVKVLANGTGAWDTRKEAHADAEAAGCEVVEDA